MRAAAPPLASRRSTRSPGAMAAAVAHGQPALVDHDGIPALERRLRRDGAQARHEVVGALAARGQRALWRAVEHPAQTRERVSARDHPVVGAAQRRPRRERLQALASAHDDALGAAAGARAQPLDVLELLAGVGHDQARRVGGRRRAAVGHEIAQRDVALVADGRDDDRGAGRDRTAEPFVRERQQVLQRAATTGDHDHVDVRAGVERRQRAHDLGHGTVALHGRLREDEARRGQAGAGVADHVERRGRLVPRDQANAARPERGLSLAHRVEEAVRVEPAPRLLDAGEQGAVAGGLDAVGAQRQLGALVVERYLAVHLHALALDRPRIDALEGPARHRHRERGALVRVAQRQERETELGVVAQVADLTLDPEGRELVDAPCQPAIDVGDGVDPSLRRRNLRSRRVGGGSAGPTRSCRYAFSDEDALGELGRAAARQQVARMMQIGVAQRNALGDLLRAAGLDEY